MTDKELYAITLKVEERYKMAGLGAEKNQMCLYADFAVDVAKMAIRSDRQRLADELQKMPLNDTASSIAIWIRDQK